MVPASWKQTAYQSQTANNPTILGQKNYDTAYVN
jgi:hypothetical protein